MLEILENLSLKVCIECLTWLVTPLLDAEKKFGPQEVDWGFKEFVELKKVYSSEFCDENRYLYFEIVVHICNQPYLLDPQSYDSRKETGFVGLQNQGATCYMVCIAFAF